MKTQATPPITIQLWARVLAIGGIAAAALMVLLGFLLPFLILDPPYGLGFHPLLARNPGPSWQNDGTYGCLVAGLLAWLGGTYAGIRTAGRLDRRERLLAGLGIAAVVAILMVPDLTRLGPLVLTPLVWAGFEWLHIARGSIGDLGVLIGIIAVGTGLLWWLRRQKRPDGDSGPAAPTR